MTPLLQTAAPLFSNDLSGFVKIVGIIVGVVLLPLGALVVYFLKQGPLDALREFRSEMNGLGSRVHVVEDTQSRLEERVNGIYQVIAESNRDVMAAIRESGQAQATAINEVKIQVARLEERNNLGQTLGAGLRELALSIRAPRE